jgi:hypothetical protein
LRLCVGGAQIIRPCRCSIGSDSGADAKPQKDVLQKAAQPSAP